MASVTEPSSGEPAYRERSLRYLIARHENNRLELFTLAAASRGEALCVFGTERAARDFLQRGGFGGGWAVRESTAGELVSLLLGHLADVEHVALDPRPGLAAPELRSTSKKDFIDVLMGESSEAPSTMRKPPGSASSGGPKR